MIVPAISLKNELHHIFQGLPLEELRFFNSSGYRKYALNIPEDEWGSVSYAVLNPTDGKPIGHLSSHLNLKGHFVTNFVGINFYGPSVHFMRGIAEYFFLIFMEYKYNHVEFYCSSSHPSIGLYEKFLSLCGGSLVGVLKRAFVEISNELSDMNIYQIMREDFESRSEVLRRYLSK